VAGDRAADPLGLQLHRPGRGRMVLYVTGELDRLTAPILVVFLAHHLGGDAPDTNLTIDLTATSFVDIGGLNALLEVQRRARLDGVTVHVGACRAQFLLLLRATGTTGLIAPAPGRPRFYRARGCRPSGGR
jgi:ABC-type transporter Mla MlaB component